MIKRRFSIFLLGIIVLVLSTGFFSCKNDREPKEITFGICADVHKDIMHDADARLQTFVDAMNNRHADFIIELGDFGLPFEYNRSFFNIWNSFTGSAYCVLGNHEMDGGFTKEQTMEYWGMEFPYYSFDMNGFHFIILDGNEKKDPPQEGYPHFIGELQKKWLKKDLENTNLPCILFSHQSLEDNWGIENRGGVRKILEDENKRVGKRKIWACFNGHSHLDWVEKINDIWYVEVNSMSYFWVGGEHKHMSYNEEIDKNFPWIKYTCPYKDPLYATVTVYGDGTIKIKGVKTEWVGPPPSEIAYTNEFYMDRISPVISDRVLK